jgi:NIMA (never in mitosis gene a)-related kinase
MLKNYIIENELGKGTYGTVYKAKNKIDNNIYVIKQISLEGLTKPQKEEVKLESEILKKIKSKYVVKYYDSFEEDNKLNIVMEYCECGDLGEYIENKKKTKFLLHEKEIWKFFLKITLGLADIHKTKILHRDLKSLNIFLKKENDIRVGDLGVAKILNQTFFAKTFIGTPYYLSPEICEDKPYNDKSDVWALGCILYELCTYQHPFTAKSQGGLILKILNDNPKPINTYYSKELSSLIDILFNKDYQKRPSCEEILRMNCVIERAKSLDIFDDIKSSFPNIDTPIEKMKINKINIKPISAHVKPIIKSTNKNIKKPTSNYGILAKGGYKNIKFNNIKSGEKKKSKNPKVLVYPNKEKNGAIPRKVIKISNKDNNNNINKSNNNNVNEINIFKQNLKEIIFLLI